MCGIAGAIIPHLHEPALLHALGRRMGEAIAHRGPDDAGTWVDAEAGLVLSHRRLSIVDLSPEGHQPMLSEDGRWAIVFNGEIYNHATLRDRLARLGHAFRGHSDTEVLLAAIAEWGVQTALQRSNGMLALAAWDRRERVLWLARDRIGKKPLYYGLAGDGSILFGSELAALRACPALQPKVDPDALALLLRLDYIPAPYSILHGVHKLPAGTLLRLDTSDTAALTEALDALPQPWWNARERQQAAIDQRFAGSEEMALDVLDALLREAVSMRMEADVPLGAFLSGGTDSSLVTALMQTQSTRPLRSFSIGFDHAGHDESTQARAVAAQLGTEHIEFHADGRAALDLVPEMPQVFDEPFADSSQLPTLLLCKLARRHVTVALSGDGGDELFFGYRRYRRALDNHARLRRLPAGLLARLVGEPGERARLGGLAALRAELATGGLQGIAHRRIQRWRLPERVVLGARRQATAYDDPAAMLANGPAADQLMAMDFASYLPEDILTKVDRTSMAVALEARAPLLDWRVVEFAWSLPQAMKPCRRRAQVPAQAPALPLPAPGAGVSPQIRLRRTDRALAARAVARLGRNLARRALPARARAFRSGPDPDHLARVPGRTAQMAHASMERADVPGMAGTLAIECQPPHLTSANTAGIFMRSRPGHPIQQTKNGMYPVQAIPIHVINLPASSDRRASMEAQAVKLGLQIDFFIAVDGSHPHPLFSHADRRKRIALKGRDFKPGELGCWASHYLLWQACLVSGAPMIIMEDDITISEDFPKLLSLLPELPGKLEYFRLHSAELPGREILRIGEFGFYRYWRSPMCTFGYYVTPQAARKFIEHADEWILPVDDYMDLAWLHGVECIGIKPGLVSCTTGFESTIQPKIRSKARPDFLGLVTRESYRAWLKTRWLLHTLRGRLE